MPCPFVQSSAFVFLFLCFRRLFCCYGPFFCFVLTQLLALVIATVKQRKSLFYLFLYLELSTYTFTFKTYYKKVFPFCRHFYSLILICHYGAITAKNLLEHRREVIYCRLRLGVGHNVLQIGDGRAFQHKC